MKYTYKVRTDVVLDEDNEPHTVYGVDAFYGDTLAKSVADVFFEYNESEEFTSLCNKLKLSFVHFMSVIDDALMWNAAQIDKVFIGC